MRQRLASEAIRVIVVDPFENNERARQLVSKSARYRSGYWVVKMFVWRFEEYTKMVYGKYTRYCSLSVWPRFPSALSVMMLRD